MINKQRIIDECVQMLKKQEIKQEIVNLFTPVVSLILKEIYPYIYLALVLVVISFLLILGIFIILLRLKFLINSKHLLK
jgi:hypothetical protein